MAIRSIEAPARGRRSKFNFTDKEIEQAGSILTEGGTPGDGGFDSIKEARSASQALKRAVEDSYEFGESTVVATQAWEDEKGNGHFILRLRDK